jgi:uncharacterized protein
MIIKVTDIPPQGRTLDFELSEHELNSRVQAVREFQSEIVLKSPSYNFLPTVRASLKLNLEGSTVVISGRAWGAFLATCGRCADDTCKEVDVPVYILLKPRTVKAVDERFDEDAHFGYYDGQEVNCATIVEEFLILALPYVVLCREDCEGLCSKCGTNFNYADCDCVAEEISDERFAVLQQLKFN